MGVTVSGITPIAPRHASVPTEFFVSLFDEISRHRKPDAFAAAGFAQDHSVDAGDSPLDIEQWSPAVAWIDRCIRLDVDHRALRTDLAGCRADDSVAQRILKPERASGRQMIWPCRS